jgi:hypothetical protein
MGKTLKARTAAVAAGAGVNAPATAADGDWLNYANIGLIVISFTLALYMPFVLFLFAYSVLGPLHYMTEISWLHQRKFFARGSYDGWFLAVLSLVWSAVAAAPYDPVRRYEVLAALAAFGFGGAWVFMSLENGKRRWLALAAVAVLSLAATQASVRAVLLLAAFLPTLVHVFVFTALFMLYGALKARSRSGYLSVAVLLLLPLLYLVVAAPKPVPTMYVLQSYWGTFGSLNKLVFGIGAPRSQQEMDLGVLRVFQSDEGLMFMRFVAFAYLYHYLNWFSKTSIIKWHQVPKARLGVLGVAWAACLGLYAYDYALGFQVLSVLSLVHVFVEFPLNSLSIIGSWRALRGSGGS